MLKPYRLCAPVDKDGETPGAETHADHLLCYKTKHPRFGSQSVFLANQFHQIEPEMLRMTELCVPSIKTLPPP